MPEKVLPSGPKAASQVASTPWGLVDSQARRRSIYWVLVVSVVVVYITLQIQVCK